MLLNILLIAVVLGVISVMRYNYRPKGYPPVMPSYVPFVGSIVPFGIDFLGFMRSGTEKYGKLWTTKLMGHRVTVVGHRDLHDIFFKPRNDVLNPSEVYKFMKPVFGPGVVYDAPHHIMRQQLGFVAEQLSQAKLKTCVPIIQREVRECLTRDWGDEGEINLLDAMASMLISTAALCLFGRHVKDIITPSKLADLLCRIEEGINPVAVFIHWLPSIGLFKQQAARREFVKIATSILEERRNDPEADQKQDIITALLDAVYRDGSEMTEDEKVGIMLGVTFAGQHTSLITSSWAISYLSSKEHAAKLKRHSIEMDTYADENGELDWEGLNEMHYTDSVFKEVLRLHPPLIMLMRKVLEPIQCGEFTIPAGDTLAVSPLASHRSNDVYRHADEFNPSRFCDAEEGSSTPWDFIGFGGGAHKCLGERFGTLQSKTVFSTILNDYEIELINGKVPEPDYTTMVVGPSRNQCMIRYKKKKC